MASSSEVFEKFSTWNKRKTLLKVVVIINGEVEEIFPSSLIFGLDPEVSTVGIGVTSTHSIRAFDIADATFSVEERRVVATRNESGWLVFEEE